MDSWPTIDTAPKDGTEILVGVAIATVPIIRNACWNDGELWEMSGFDDQADLMGWWSPDNSVCSTKLEGMYEPTHWHPMPTGTEGE